VVVFPAFALHVSVFFSLHGTALYEYMRLCDRQPDALMTWESRLSRRANEVFIVVAENSRRLGAISESALAK
jgi:hypothetical protein